MARIGIELNLFEILVKNDDVPTNAKTLAGQAGVDPSLMSLLLCDRYRQFVPFILRRSLFEILCVIRHDRRGWWRSIYCLKYIQSIGAPWAEGMYQLFVTFLRNRFLTWSHDAHWYQLGCSFETISKTYVNLPKFLRKQATKISRILLTVHGIWLIKPFSPRSCDFKAIQQIWTTFWREWLRNARAHSAGLKFFLFKKKIMSKSWAQNVTFCWHRRGDETSMFGTERQISSSSRPCHSSKLVASGFADYFGWRHWVDDLWLLNFATHSRFVDKHDLILIIMLDGWWSI